MAAQILNAGRRRDELPTGTLTFLFSDIEGSTRLVAALGSAWTGVLERHQALLRAAFVAAGGIEIATEGDSFFVVFIRASDALAAAADAQRALAAEPWPEEVGTLRVRMGLHTGDAMLGGDNYVGLDVHRAARIAASANGGQVIVSDATRGLAETTLAPGLSLRELGSHRLKDLDEPVRLFQLGIAGLADDLRPPRTLESPTNLPVQLTSFVGRAREIADVQSLLRGSRLVTLLGPGGTGKTRLALRVAETMRLDFPDGRVFVDLSPIVEPGLVVTALARALGVREEPRRTYLESLEAHLGPLRALIVLDNFEQVLPAASLIGRLLAAAPAVTVLATSREVLRVRGEQEYPVPPLATPDPRRMSSIVALETFESVALFIQRARAVRPAFALDDSNANAIAAICAQLDGLPLAIELAAARVKLLPPDAILARLARRLAVLTSGGSDLPERQRTLRAAIDWSHDLLDSTERTLFRRLAVFVGGWTIADADAICDPDDALGTDMLDALGGLVDKSLVRQLPGTGVDPRFGMLETIREYAVERLEAADDAIATRLLHEEQFAAMAVAAEPELLGTRSNSWLDRLEEEAGNLRAAWQNAASGGRLDRAMNMAAAMWRFWLQRGHLAEGNGALRALLDQPGAEERTLARVRALGALGGVCYWQGDFDAAGRAYAEALDIARSLDDPAALGEAFYNAGFNAAVVGQNQIAAEHYEQGLAIYERLGDRAGMIRMREAMVFLMFHQREFGAARALAEANLAAFRESGEPFRIANALDQLSAIQFSDGDFAGARENQAQAVRIFLGARDMQGVIRVLVLSAARAVREEDYELAARMCGAADTLKEPLGTVATPVEILGLDDPAVVARTALGEERFALSYQAGRALSVDEAAALI